MLRERIKNKNKNRYVETNCDISHYIFREILQGRSLQRITSQAGHTHQRMARRLGDVRPALSRLHNASVRRAPL